MKKLIYLIIFLLCLQLVYAEQFVLIQDQTIDFKGINIKLNSVGTSGSLNLNINGLTRLLEQDNPVEVYGITIELIKSELTSATVDITHTGSCLIDTDCDDNKAGTRDICKNGYCTHIVESGCILNDECKDHFTLGKVNNILSYCARDNDWHPRKEAGEACFNNAECLSNLCKETCQTIKEETKMAPAWILIIIGAILISKSLFGLLKPGLSKRILKNLATNFSDNAWRIFYLIILIIGIALVVWTLI